MENQGQTPSNQQPAQPAANAAPASVSPPPPPAPEQNFNDEFRQAMKAGGNNASDDKPSAEPAAPASPPAPPAPSGAQSPPAGADTAAGKPQSPPAAPTPAAPAIDWAKVDPNLKAAYDASSDAGKPAIEALVRQNLQRGQEIASLRSKVSSRRISTPAVSAAPASTSSGAPVVTSALANITATLDSKEFKDLERDAPEIAGPLRKVTGELANALKAVGSEVNATTTTVRAIAESEQASALDQQTEILTERHSDWETLLSGDGQKKFDQWVASQPPYIQRMVANNSGKNGVVDGAEAADVFDRYKRDMGLASQPSPTPAAQQPTGGAAQPQPSPIDERRSRQIDSAASPGQPRGLGPNAGVSENDFGAAFKEASRLKREAARAA